jgi:hypothetical protein
MLKINEHECGRNMTMIMTDKKEIDNKETRQNITIRGKPVELRSFVFEIIAEKLQLCGSDEYLKLVRPRRRADIGHL